MEQRRLFIGSIIQAEDILKVYPEIKDNFYHVVKAKWTEEENLHINFKFLGEVPEDKLPIIKETLADLLKVYESPLKFHAVGCFPNFENPRVLFMNVYSPDKSILAAAAQIETALETIGFPKEKRRFKPHMTLARIKNIYTGFEDVIKDFEKVVFTKVNSYSVNIIESRLTQEGPIYKIIE